MHITVWESLFSALPCHTCRSGFVHAECAPQFRFSSGRIPRHKFIRRSSKVHGQMLVDRCSDTICKLCGNWPYFFLVVIFHACGIGFFLIVHVYRVYFCYPPRKTGCIFFGKPILGPHLWEKIICCCSFILAAYFFPRSSVLLPAFRFVS